MTVGFHDPPGRFWIGGKYRGISGFPVATPILSPVAWSGFAAGHSLMFSQHSVRVTVLICLRKVARLLGA
jgi:hypothetical protein